MKLKRPDKRLAVTSRFGPRWLLGMNWHYGTDFAPPGALAHLEWPVEAPTDGIIIGSAYDVGFGNYVTLLHNTGQQEIHIILAHMEKRLVRVGDKVVMGQTVGIMGSTGKSTGKHLHLECRWLKNKQWTAFNPDKYFI